jgi:hypothetical protein
MRLTATLAGHLGWDDNVFATRESDEAQIFHRYRGQLQADYAPNPRTSFSAGYATDAEFFPDRPELDRWFGRHNVAAGLGLSLGRDTTLSASGHYTVTHWPEELIEETGVISSRRRAEGIGAHLGIGRRLGPRNTLNLGYGYRQLTFGGGDPEYFHTASLGWARELSRRWNFTVWAGPTFNEESVRATGAVSLAHRFRTGALTFGYSRSRMSTPSEGRVADADTGSATLSLEKRKLQFSIGPSYHRIRSERADTDVYRASTSLSYSLARWLSMSASYRYAFQRTVRVRDDSGIPTDDEISRSSAWVGFVASHSMRVR